MLIYKVGTIYGARATYEERLALKGAGFWWHPGRPCGRHNCDACRSGYDKGWWTPKVEVAAKLAQYADASVRPDLEMHRERQVERAQAVAASKAVDIDPSVELPVPPGLAYLPFQRAGIAYGVSRPNFILADEMGLGKTIQALGIINADPTIRNVLLVVPSSLILNWKREAEKWLIRPMRIRVIETMADAPSPDDQLVIVNYDKFGYKEKSVPLFDALRSRQWDMVVADEAHRVKNPKAQRTKMIVGDLLPKRGEPETVGLVGRAKRRLFMTGTPWLNSPIELWPLLVAACPQLALLEQGQPMSKSYWRFAYRWCVVEKTRWGTNILGGKPQAMPRLQEELRAACMVRRTKEEVLKELPAKVRQVITLEAKGMEREIERENRAFAQYDDAFQELEAKVELAKASGDEDVYEQAVAKLRQAYRVAFEEMSKVRHAVAVKKMPMVIERVTDMVEEGVGKVIVFAHHRDVLEGMFSKFEDAGYEPAMIIGGQDRTEVEEGKARFQTDPKCKVIVCSIMAAGVGHTLTAANYVVFAELDWVPGNITQAEDRAHRIGQEKTVFVQHLVVDGSLDAKMAKTLVAKQEVFKKGLDDEITIDIPVIPTTPPHTPEADEREREARDRERADVAVTRKYPVASNDERVAAQQAMRMLAGMCDSAQSRDNMGFNKMDAHIGHQLARLPGPFTDGQVALARRLATTYRRQLPAPLLQTLKVAAKPGRERVRVEPEHRMAADLPPF